MDGYCRRNEKRNLFCLFKVYTCVGCNRFKTDEVIIIGNKKILIFPLTNCSLIEIADEYIFFSKRLKKLLLSFVMYQENTILLWVDEINYIENYELIFESFIDLDYDIFIIQY